MSKLRFSYTVAQVLGYRIPSLFETDESFERFKAVLVRIRESGFQGIQLSLHADDLPRLSRIGDQIHDAGLKIACVGTGLVYARDGASFSDSDATKREKAISVAKSLLDFAAQDKASVIVGFIRRPHSVADGVSDADPAYQQSKALAEKEVAMKHFINSMKECDDHASKSGGILALEAAHRYEAPFLHTANEVASFIENHGLRATGLLLDTFHMNIEEPSMEDAIARHISKLVHFHMVDSNRWPPTYGHIKIEDSLKLLDALGYKGWASQEALPLPSNEEALETTTRFLKLNRFI